MIPFAEWVPAVGHVAGVLGADAARLVREMLDRAPRMTPWARAARQVAEATLARHAGDVPTATDLLRSAAASYAQMTDVTDEIITMALAIGPLAETDPSAATVARARLHEFATRHHAPTLLRLP
ncbi:hypothetical protein JM949_10660 [Micromonospora sp. STR1s_6]|uniref:Uncharacterized protein n=1 Tax=Micromonospora tarensis TaxID=2806100 RepID=A0ABS1YEV5_9ACTN|nr:hypothetical protein [Micromonospora tarensis]